MAPHCLVIPLPLKGHVRPMLNLATTLASSSPHDLVISFAVPHKLFLQLLHASPDGSSSTNSLLPNNVRLLSLSLEDMQTDTLEVFHFVDEIEEETDRLIQRLNEEDEESRVSCLVADSFFVWPQNMANKWEIPRATVWCSNAWAFSIYLHVPLLRSTGFIRWGEFNEAEHSRNSHDHISIPGLPPIARHDVPSYFDAPNEEVGTFMTLTKQFQGMREADWILLNTCCEVEKTAIEALQTQLPQIIPVGPLLPFSFLTDMERRMQPIKGNEDLQYMKWLDKQDPDSVLYVSFGSIATLSSVQLLQLAKGLEASEHSFIWVFRAGLVEDEEMEMGEFLDGFRERTKMRGVVIPWADDQTHVLSHPAIGGFMSHCGWNSLYESICMGVPVLAWPMIAEQDLNCKLVVEELKVGMRMKNPQTMYEVVSSEVVERCVRSLMAEDEGRKMRARVKQLMGRVRKSYHLTSLQQLELFVTSLCK